MKHTIRRGINQIRGCVNAIERGGYQVFIDLGKQQTGPKKKELATIEQLTYGDVSKSALFMTDYHG